MVIVWGCVLPPVILSSSQAQDATILDHNGYCCVLQQFHPDTREPLTILNTQTANHISLTLRFESLRGESSKYALGLR